MRGNPNVFLLWACAGCLVVHATCYLGTGGTRGGRYKRESGDADTNSSHKWFTQLLDHFDPNNNDEWQQRYWVNEDYYRRGAPVFLYVAGEWEETGFSEELSEPWEKTAVLHRALMFKLEHRFYGGSQPTDGNLTVEDLQYLSSEQALADLANFIVTMSRQFQLPPHPRWIAFGCSYSATLAAWLRYKYPHLVYAAVASSAPLLFTVNFPEYYNSMGKTISEFYGEVSNNIIMGEMCLRAFKHANEEVKELMKSPEGFNETLKLFGLTDMVEFDAKESFGDDNNASQAVFNILFSYVDSAVQNNGYDYATETWSIERLCDTLLNESFGEIIDRYAQVYNDARSEADESDNETLRQWYYQMCSEFGFFQTIKDDSSIFGDYVNETFFLKSCVEEYDDRFTEEFINRRVDRTNNMYGGLGLDISRILYVYGTADPWFTLGRNCTTNPLSPVILIEGGKHCSDTYAPSYLDSVALVAARTAVENTLKNWLKASLSTNLVSCTNKVF